jgi:transporter family protein
MTWFLFSILAAVFWAVGQVLVKKGFEAIPPLYNNIFSNTVILFTHIVPVLFLSRFSIVTPPLSIFVVIVVQAAFFHTFYYAISKGEVSLTATVVAVYPVFTILLSHLILHETLSLLQLSGVGIVIAGVVLVALPDRAASENVRHTSWIVWGLACSVLMGTGDFMAKFSIDRIGSYSHIFFLALISNPMGAVNYLIDKKARRLPALSGKKALPTLLGITIVSVGTLLFLIAMGRGKASLIAPVSSIYPAIITVLAVRFLGERITPRQGAGIGAIVLGLVLVGIGSI